MTAAPTSPSPLASRPSSRAPRASRPGGDVYFMPYQAKWIKDTASLRIVEKSRQIGLSYAESYRDVKLAAGDRGLDVWVMSRDEVQAKEFMRYCQRWAKILNHAAKDLGEVIIEDRDGKAIKVQATEFTNGRRIYCLSSNPDAIVGKTGHVVLDEFALHKDQRQLIAVAKPVTQWGGTLTIISTHRGHQTLFNDLIRGVRERGNPMGWSLHTIPITTAVEQGLVEKIAAATGRPLTRDAWLAKQRAECVDAEQWAQEYLCQPSDDSAAWLEWELITACESQGTLRDMRYLVQESQHPLYLGFDVARSQHLSVIDVGELIGDVMHDRLRLEMRGSTFAAQKLALWSLLSLPHLKRACIDRTGIGAQIAEEAAAAFPWKAEGVIFNQTTKTDLAVTLKRSFQDRRLRIDPSPELRADLRGIRKEVTSAGNERFVGESADSHCDRFWALALRVHAAKPGTIVPGVVIA